MKRFLDFVKNTPTAFHAVNELKNILFVAISKYVPHIIVNQNNIKIFYNTNDNKYKIIIPYMLNNSIEIQTYELIL